MGILGLQGFITKKYPQVIDNFHISKFAYKKIAIDFSVYLFIYKIARKERWLEGFIYLIEFLRKHEVHPVIIYDNKAPVEKDDERLARAKDRETRKNRIINVESALKIYSEKSFESKDEENDVIEVLKEFQKSKKISVPLLKNLGVEINIPEVERELSKLKNYSIQIHKEDFILSKELFLILGVPIVQAYQEAETLCAKLVKNNQVDGVLSKDTDLLAYGVSFIFNFNTKTGVCNSINYKYLINELELSDKEFLDFCIMCGTDYNKNIPKIGIVSSYNYIKKYKSIEEFKNNTNIPIDCLNHIRGRELFTKNQNKTELIIPWCVNPDFDKLHNFLENNNLFYNISSLKKSFEPNFIID